jgi:hypothetical protein
VDLQNITAELLAGPLDEFTARRNARVKALKASGDAALAADVAALKKPPVYLWAANRVATEDPDLLRSVEQAARSVAKAQTGRGTTARDLRAASEAFQNALDAAGKAAERRLQADHHAAGDDAIRRVRDIFRSAALQGAATLNALRMGALLTEPAAGEDDVIAMFQAGAPAPKDKGAKAASSTEADPHAVRAAERAARMDAERAEQLGEVARRLRAEADQAAEQAQRADERAKAAEQQAAEAKRAAAKSARAAGSTRR